MKRATSSPPFKRILAAVDGGPAGIRAARMAGRLARALDARLTLLTVCAALLGSVSNAVAAKARGPVLVLGDER